MGSKVIWVILSFVLSTLGVGEWNTFESEDFAPTKEEVVEVVSYVEPNEETIVLEEEPIDTSIEVNSTMPYYIRINRLQNVVNIYKKSGEGKYVPYRVMVCSTGEATPEAGEVHQVTDERYRWSWLSGGVYGQYVTNIVGGIYFHSVPYTKISNDALEYWEYDKLGTTASLGCVRLTTEDAKWVYENIKKGTTVEFYEDEEPGPMGKPEAQKISENEQCRNWDPTDEEVGNPWREWENRSTF